MIKRTIPPAAAPVSLKKVLGGIAGLIRGRSCIDRLNREAREFFGTGHVYPVSSGKAALTVALRALKGLSPGREKVVIPAYTCYSVPSAVLRAGLRITLCDVDGKNFDYDHAILEKTVDGETLCVVTNNLFGIPSWTERVLRLCRERGAYVVEDAAQAMGVRSSGRLVGTIADASVFSFGRGKNVTCGSGGLIVTGSKEVAGAIDREYSSIGASSALDEVKELAKVAFMWLFMRPNLYWFPSSLPFLRLGETVFPRDFPVRRLSGAGAGMLSGWRDELEESNRARAENSGYFLRRLNPSDGDRHVLAYLRLPVLVDGPEEKRRLLERSERDGLGLSGMYPSPVNEIEEIRSLFTGEAYPAAKDAAERLVTLPTHHLLREEDRDNIFSILDRGPASPAYHGSSGSKPA